MARFQVVMRDHARQFPNWQDFEPYGEWDDPSFLVDTEKQEIVFSDQCEPEDATLGRAFWPLVELLNSVGKED